MIKYGCMACDEQFDTFEEALPHHNQIAGHNIYTLITECPSCARYAAKIKDREGLAKVIDRIANRDQCQLYDDEIMEIADAVNRRMEE